MGARQVPEISVGAASKCRGNHDNPALLPSLTCLAALPRMPRLLASHASLLCLACLAALHICNHFAQLLLLLVIHKLVCCMNSAQVLSFLGHAIKSVSSIYLYTIKINSRADVVIHKQKFHCQIIIVQNVMKW